MKINGAALITVGAGLALVGALAWSIVGLHNWTEACTDAGGKVEQRYEYTINTFTYTYDAKGNITAVIPTITPVYSYHCWRNGQEIEVDK